MKKRDSAAAKMLGKSLAALWYRPGQKAVMTSHTAPMAPATPFFHLSAYQTPTVLSSKSFFLLFPGNQSHRSPPPVLRRTLDHPIPRARTTRPSPPSSPVGADDPGGPPPSYRPPSPTTPPYPPGRFPREGPRPFLWSFQGGLGVYSFNSERIHPQMPPSILGTPRPVGRSPSCQPPRTML